MVSISNTKQPQITMYQSYLTPVLLLRYRVEKNIKAALSSSIAPLNDGAAFKPTHKGHESHGSDNLICHL